MKNFILIGLLTIVSITLFGQDNIPSSNYKRQIGLDVKPLINTFSGYGNASSFLSEYEILYKTNLSPKYSLMGKLGYVPSNTQTIAFSNIIPEDSSQITHLLYRTSYAKLEISLSKKIVKKKVNLYWGITTGLNLNNGIALTIEYDTIPSPFYQHTIISNTTSSKNFLQLTFGPYFGLEYPINERWHILANFNFTGTMELGTWEYSNGDGSNTRRNIYSGLTYELQLLRDIGIMYSF